eukprot:SAG31_NODE_8963_length_1356_cov_1.139220_2_plen_69_part_00
MVVLHTGDRSPAPTRQFFCSFASLSAHLVALLLSAGAWQAATKVLAGERTLAYDFPTETPGTVTKDTV